MAQKHRPAFERGSLTEMGDRIMELIGGMSHGTRSTSRWAASTAPPAERGGGAGRPRRRPRAGLCHLWSGSAGFSSPTWWGSTDSWRCGHRGAIPSSRACRVPRTGSMSHRHSSPNWWSKIRWYVPLRCKLGWGELAYLTGPLARDALNVAVLPDEVRRPRHGRASAVCCTNPFRSIVVRAVEIAFACHEALALVEWYRGAERPAVPVPDRAGVGTGATEAPARPALPYVGRPRRLHHGGTYCAA